MVPVPVTLCVSSEKMIVGAAYGLRPFASRLRWGIASESLSAMPSPLFRFVVWWCPHRLYLPCNSITFLFQARNGSRRTGWPLPGGWAMLTES